MTCSVEGCDRPTRRKTAQMCEAHYYRVRRTGQPGSATIDTHRRGHCAVEDCDKIADGGNGWCAMHYTRWKRHGDPLTYIAPADRNLPKREATHWWAGDDVTYSGMHQRLRNYRGSARDHACVDCGSKAAQWSFDRLDPEAKSSDLGPYSTSLDHYVPRCVPCHKRFDLAAGRK